MCTCMYLTVVWKIVCDHAPMCLNTFPYCSQLGARLLELVIIMCVINAYNVTFKAEFVLFHLNRGDDLFNWFVYSSEEGKTKIQTGLHLSKHICTYNTTFLCLLCSNWTVAHAATWNLFVYLIHHLYILIYPSVDHQYSGPIKMRLILDQLKYHTCRLIKLTIGSYISVHSSRYEARRKFREHKRWVRVTQGIAESNSSFLSFNLMEIFFFSRDLFADVMSVPNRNMKHIHWIEFD